MTAQIKDGNLVITIPIDKKPSKTGKSILIASSGGNKKTELEVDGKQVFIGLNAYIEK